MQLSSASGFKPPVDENLERLKEEIQEAERKLAGARMALDEYPVNQALHEVRREIRNIIRSLPATAVKVAGSREEIHGITRLRVAAIIDKLGQRTSVEEADLTAEPSIYGEIRNYLRRWRIFDRLSFERALFGYSGGSNAANWYGNCGDRGLFPRNLVEIVLGRKLTHLTEANLVAAGDKLFGELDRDSIAREMRTLLASRGANSRSQVLQLPNSIIGEVARESCAGSATVLFRILAGSRPRLLPGSSMAEALADSLFPVN